MMARQSQSVNGAGRKRPGALAGGTAVDVVFVSPEDVDEIVDVVIEAVELDLPPGRTKAGPPTELERILACERAVGYVFADKTHLRNALTHSSSTADKTRDNERMEFFGDAVLDLVVREFLYHNYPDRQEGDLTEAKSALVCRSSLVRAAQRLGLREFLHLGRGMGRRRAIPDSLLADAFEAVVAAVYLDGGYQPVRDFILMILGSEIPRAIEEMNAANHKSNLQKLLQQRKRRLPAYRLLGASGPEHSRIFEVAVMVEGREMGRGSGSSKKTAEQQAARSALERYGSGMDD